jgi:hypothetical protein
MRKNAATISLKARVALVLTAAAASVFIGATAAQAGQSEPATPGVPSPTVTASPSAEGPWNLEGPWN